MCHTKFFEQKKDVNFFKDDSKALFNVIQFGIHVEIVFEIVTAHVWFKFKDKAFHTENIV